MQKMLAAVKDLLDEIERDENGGGLLSRNTLKAASILRLEMMRVQPPDEEAWRALVNQWAIRAENLEAVVASYEGYGPEEFVDRINKVLAEPDPPLVPGQMEMEAQSDG